MPQAEELRVPRRLLSLYPAITYTFSLQALGITLWNIKYQTMVFFLRYMLNLGLDSCCGNQSDCIKGDGLGSKGSRPDSHRTYRPVCQLHVHRCPMFSFLHICSRELQHNRPPAPRPQLLHWAKNPFKNKDLLHLEFAIKGKLYAVQKSTFPSTMDLLSICSYLAQHS